MFNYESLRRICYRNIKSIDQHAYAIEQRHSVPYDDALDIAQDMMIAEIAEECKIDKSTVADCIDEINQTLLLEGY